MSETIQTQEPSRRAVGRGLPHWTIVAAALVAAAAGAGATTLVQKSRAVTLVALAPESVSALKDGTMAAIKGDVAEVFGNKFVVDDGSGRALVETGRRGADTTLVAKGEVVTVQGRFEHGFLHAAAITHADGQVDSLDPPPPPHDPEHGPRPPA